MTRSLRTLFVAAVLCGACGGPGKVHTGVVDAETRAPPPEQSGLATRYVANEQLEWKLTIRSIEGGRMTIAAGEPGQVDGRETVIVALRVETSGMAAIFSDRNEESTTWLDVQSSFPRRHRAVLTKRKKSEILDVEYAPDELVLVATRGDQTKRLRRKTAPGASAYNLSSSLFALRGWQAQPGQRSTFFLLAQSRVWRVTAQLTGREKLETSLGQWNAIRIDGVAVRLKHSGEAEPNKQRRFSLWFSDDDYRLPLLILSGTKFGPARAELVSYSGGDRSLPE